MMKNVKENDGKVLGNNSLQFYKNEIRGMIDEINEEIFLRQIRIILKKHMDRGKDKNL